VGAGTWADNGTCAISATGTGEAFARLAFARRVADLVELGSLTIEDAAIKALSEVEAVKGIGGCIIVNRQGHFSLPFNSAMMLRGWTRGKGPAHVAILPNENILCG
jgi:beta-aspartyl-peptidase (threonine type)